MKDDKMPLDGSIEFLPPEIAARGRRSVWERIGKALVLLLVALVAAGGLLGILLSRLM